MLEYKKENCINCGLCEKVCPFGAIEIKEGFPAINDNCTECGICAQKCPVNAFHMEQDKIRNQRTEEYRGFWVIGLEKEGEPLNKVTLELLSTARKLADEKKEKVTLLIKGFGECENWKREAQRTGCDKILLIPCEHPGYDAKLYIDAIECAVRCFKPEAVLFPATVNGRDLAPRVSGRIGTGLTADCTGLSLDENGDLLQVRPTYGGSVMASILTPEHRPQMASVRPNVMEIHWTDEEREIETAYLEDFLPTAEDRVTLIECLEKNNVFADLTEANIVIAGGYGLKNKENFSRLFRLCDKLNAAAAATRKAVDEGWAPAEIQVGQTGTTIAPDLYIAFGVSGALQHTLGMKNAKKIIAVNHDPAAPIFDICDVAILGDAGEVLEECCKILEYKEA